MITKNRVSVINVKAIADYFIYKSNYDDLHRRSITPLKLQKLIYYAQAWFVAMHDDKMLFDNEIEAWVHGPVVPEIYREYKRYGYNDISKNVDKIPKAITDDSDIESVLTAVWKMYNNLDAKDLEKLTHSEAPWKNARENLPPYAPSNAIISVDSMADYYTEYIN